MNVGGGHRYNWKDLYGHTHLPFRRKRRSTLRFIPAMDAVVGEEVYALMFVVMKMAPAFGFYFSAVLHGAHTGNGKFYLYIYQKVSRALNPKQNMHG